jgi:bifunctional non-homologous end joining protein LigD
MKSKIWSGSKGHRAKVNKSKKPYLITSIINHQPVKIVANSSKDTSTKYSFDELKKYRSKRNFKKTAEPPGKLFPRHSEPPLAFVIQKHQARRLHYDLRLEMEGVLKSWAVPKGPSLNPADKRLAVQVEDHPLEYFSFEGTIPPGEYGAGKVVVWDKGIWKPFSNHPFSDYLKGHMKFSLEGKRLKGAWVLVRMKRKSKSNKDWLLIKDNDQYANTDYDVMLETSSVTEAKRIDGIKHGKDISVGYLSKKLAQFGSKEDFPATFSPQLTSLSIKAPKGEDWVHEIKFDGYRIMAIKQPQQKVKLLTRNMGDWTAKFTKITSALDQLKAESFLIDGELCVLDEKGKTSFSDLQSFLKGDKKVALTYFCFDLLYLNGFSLVTRPLLDRKEILKQLLDVSKKSGTIRFVEHVVGNGPDFYAEACKRGIEGIVSKKSSKSYRMARTRDWLKVKCQKREQFLVCGFTKLKGSSSSIGALLLGRYQAEKLNYVGRVGSGFSERAREEIFAKLKARAIPHSPFKHPLMVRGVTFCKPEVLAKVRFAERTQTGLLRLPVFEGLRKVSSPLSDRRKLTNPEKPLFEKASLTKAKLASYYSQASSFMLKELAGRPLVLVRCPKGTNNKCFYQKHINPKSYPEVRTVKVPGKNKLSQYATVSSLDDLLALVQINVVEIHCWGARKDKLESPDRLIFDLDPDPKLPLEVVKQAGFLIRELLSELSLESFVRVTGGKGIHVVAPLRRVHSWLDLKLFSAEIARLVESQDCQLFTSRISKERRQGKIFIDYFRNQRGASSIANYSPRAKKAGPIAMPLTWGELKDIPAFNFFNLENSIERIATLNKDPWEKCYSLRQQIKKSAFKALGLDDAAHREKTKRN